MHLFSDIGQKMSGNILQVSSKHLIYKILYITYIDQICIGYYAHA